MSVTCSPAPTGWRTAGAVGEDPWLGPPVGPSREGDPVPDPESYQPPADEERRRLRALIALERTEGAEGSADHLECLCRSVTSELDIEGAVVTLMPTLGTHAVSATSSESTRLHEEEQFGLGEGPTQDAYSSGQPVLVADLEQAAIERWPVYAPVALTSGVRGIHSFPLHVGATIFGALTLYLRTPRAFDRQEMRIALTFAELATQIMVDRSGTPSVHLDPHDHDALATHGHIYQAQGMLMVDLGVTLPDALARMRAHAYAAGQDLTSLAADIIADRTRLPRDRS